MATVEVPHTLEYKGGQLNAAPVLEVENFTNWKRDSPDDKDDTKSSHEYLNDIEEEYQVRALLAKFKRVFKKGNQRFSSVKATDNVTNVARRDILQETAGQKIQFPHMTGEDYEGPLVFDDDQYGEESMPVYDTDIEDVIEEEEGYVGKGGFGGEEDNIEDVVVVANDLCS
ncbi:hypothetical protein Tco_0812179 [Tanacetum coccineum]